VTTAVAGEVVIAVEHPDRPDIRALIGALNRYLLGLYRPEDCHHLTIEELARPDVTFVVARRDGAAIGCGALRRLDASLGEVKRMFTVEDARRRGVGRRILQSIEAAARRAGCTTLVLETGPRQAEALALYLSEGFHERGPFFDYPADGISIFMEKRLS
jgi:putative acetyltransferase